MTNSESAAQPGPSHPLPSTASPEAEAPSSSEPHGARGSSSSGGKKCYKLENEKLFQEAPRTRGSRRQIQRLEQLLALYVAEIRRLQERELDLSELDDPDSTYLQEARLKRC